MPLPAWATRVGGRGTRSITTLLDQFIEQVMTASPQLMTAVGLDVGPSASARSRLDDRSPAGLERFRSLFSKLAADLAALDPNRLSQSDWVNHQTAAYLAATTLKSFDFPFGDPTVVAIPYIVSQLS